MIEIIAGKFGARRANKRNHDLVGRTARGTDCFSRQTHRRVLRGDQTDFFGNLLDFFLLFDRQRVFFQQRIKFFQGFLIFSNFDRMQNRAPHVHLTTRFEMFENFRRFARFNQ